MVKKDDEVYVFDKKYQVLVKSKVINVLHVNRLRIIDDIFNIAIEKYPKVKRFEYEVQGFFDLFKFENIYKDKNEFKHKKENNINLTKEEYENIKFKEFNRLSKSIWFRKIKSKTIFKEFYNQEDLLNLNLLEA